MRFQKDSTDYYRITGMDARQVGMLLAVFEYRITGIMRKYAIVGWETTGIDSQERWSRGAVPCLIASQEWEAVEIKNDDNRITGMAGRMWRDALCY